MDEIIRDNGPTAQTKTMTIKALGEFFCESVGCGGEEAQEKTLIMGKVMHLNSGDTGYISWKLLELLTGLEGSRNSASPSIAATTRSETRQTTPLSHAAPSSPAEVINLELEAGH